jgi:hypothetical protein
MIKFEHNGRQISWWKACWKGYDGVHASRWNPKVEPFVAWWIVQKEEHTKVGVVENHMLPWGVARKGKCCCRLMLKFQERKDVDQP